MHKHEAIIATNRFGLGARPGEAKQAASDPRAWLKAQLVQGDSSLDGQGLKPSDEALRAYYEFREARRKQQETDAKALAEGKEPVEAKRPDAGSPRSIIAAEIEARTKFAILTEQSFRERLVRFWSNHFTVSTSDVAVVSLAGAFEREAIRPHVTGSFFDMLLAAETHPAMMLYLDNARSIGPNSPVGRRRDLGLNENLAREILELHTLGVDGGYTQNDVIEFARALTGWTVSSPRDRNVEPGKTHFDERRHEPGARTVLGKTYADDGPQQVATILRDLALTPQTAKHVSERLARHFIADQPPKSAVDKLSRSFLDSKGDLGRLSATLVDLEEAWRKDQPKFKSPDEFQVSAMRGLGAPRVERRALRAAYGSLGQSPFTAPSPAGWPDEAEAWLGPDAVKKRLEWSQAVAARLGERMDPVGFLGETVGEFASARTLKLVGRAESREQGMALALMTPEFQRR
jgi:uncharacterized protein (DUF1800 family)